MAFKALVVSGLIRIEVHNHKWCPNREIINKFLRDTFRWVRQRATRACITHALHISVHMRKVEAQINTMKMKYTICVQMTSTRIHVKSNDDNVVEFLRNNL